MRGEVLGVERRRRWSDEEKLAIVSSVGLNGATITRVAQLNDVTRQQVYAWRHELMRIPEHAPTHSDNMRPLVPGYPPTRDALP